MKLIIGLGNPGKEYEKTRHNAGFMCVDELREKLDAPPFKINKKFNAEITEGHFADTKYLLAKPQTFMNNSGKAVQTIFNFYKDHFLSTCCGCPDCERENLQNFWVIYDDIDLPLGKIRIRKEGSGGSHNGMQSVIRSLGFKDFPRMRIGIESRGASAPKNQDISSFVLEPFQKEELPLIKESLKNASEAFLTAFKKGIAKAMDIYNI
ncbi:aminoacyl-tRNA hydrolase [Candidatus Peregrinibacteria bacterium]|nr:aminoacyl-tRNA hydrolase [Candidatus Peregrinibacteria bacterium]